MRLARAALAAWCAAAWALPETAYADNPMGYRVVTPQEAAGLPHNGGTLGLELQRAEMINDAGVAFEIMRVDRVHDRSPGARAGFHPGDELISVNGRVFPSLAVFAAYVGSLPPGQPASVDYIPAGGGPAQAQRVQVVPGGSAAPGMSTKEKVAIGVGAAALFGCYELGCFSHRKAPPPAQQPLPPARY